MAGFMEEFGKGKKGHTIHLLQHALDGAAAAGAVHVDSEFVVVCRGGRGGRFGHVYGESGRWRDGGKLENEGISTRRVCIRK